MLRLSIALIFGLISMSTFAQSDCNIEDAYQSIFSIEKQQYKEREYFHTTVNTIDTSSCFADLVNNYSMYLDYLLTNFSDLSYREELMAIEDTNKLQREFVRSLQKDSVFNGEMHNLTKRITDKTNFIPDTVSMDEMLNIAVKYFALIDIQEDDAYVGKVCIGINGLDETEEERKPQMEAFAFTAIMNNFQSKEYNMYDEFVKGIRELYKINLGTDTDDRLLRAQGAMYMFMRQNDKLKTLLLQEYKNNQKYLPFILKTE